MKLLILLGLGAFANAAQTREPVSKIITMLDDLAAKSEEEGKTEALSYEKFEYWCTNSFKTLKKAIKGEEEKIAELESEIEGLSAQEETLTEEIAKLVDELAELAKSDTDAAFERGEEAKLYRIADKDLTDTITAVDNAISSLETAETNTDTGFLQVQEKVQFALDLASSRQLTEKQHSAISAFIQQTSFGGASQDLVTTMRTTVITTVASQVSVTTTTAPAPAARPDFLAAGNMTAHVNKYSFKSNSVIELLKELKQKFEEDKLQNVKEETNAINAYELAKEARDDSRDAKTKSKKAKSDELTEVQNDLSTAKADLLVVQGDLRSDSATLKATEQSCALKKTEWDQRSLVRSQELEALAAAAKILAKATNLRTDKPDNPVPPPSPYTGQTSEGATLSFLQVDPVARAVQILRGQARAQHSKALDLLAQQISAGGPFDKVNNMIEKMIFRLMDEQKDEDVHKQWCDKELSKTNTSLDHKDDKIADLNAKIATEKGREGTLTREIGDDRDMIASIQAHMAEAAEIREIGKKENALAIKDAKEAQNVIAEAIAVIEEYYKDSGKLDKESWEFVQQAPTMTSDPVTLPSTPATWSSSYTGVADPSQAPKGIVSVLKATSADFATMEADTLAQEATDQSMYEADMKDCKIEKAGREQSVEMKVNEKKRIAAQIAKLSTQLKDISEERAATAQYLSDLQPACVEGGSTYEARKAARSQEIEALRQAQNILTNAFNAPGPAAAFLQASAPAAAPPGSSFLQQKRR